MKWFQNLGTQTKLVSSFCFVAAIAMTMGLLGTKSILRIKENLRVVYEDYTVAAADIGNVSVGMSQIMDEIVICGDANDPRVIQQSCADGREIRKVIEKSISDYAATTLRVSKSGRDEARDLAALRGAFTSLFDALDEEYRILGEADRSNLAAAQSKARAYHVANVAPKIDAVQHALGEQFLTIRDVAKDMDAEGVRSANMGQSTMLGGALLSLVLGVLIGLFVARMIARPLGEAVVVLEAVAAGDFTQRLNADTKDEVGRMATALNAAVEGIRGAMSEVRQAAETVSTASGQLSAASQSISSGAQEQASSLEETAASLEQMTSAVKQNADNASHAAQLARGAREVAEKGGEVVSTAVNAMSEINSSSRKIADIITAIDEIAFQTNLLALNAAVEAARAGEQGRGFAVVAAEVRNLAQRSASSAKEIKTLINDSVDKVEAGSKLVNQSGETLGEIVASVKRVTDIVGEIAASSREQSTGIEQVNTAVSQMDSVTQANASQTEEMSATASNLSEQAVELMNIVRRFKLDNNGSSAPASSGTASHVLHASTPARKPLKLMKRGSSRLAAKAAPTNSTEVAATGTDGGFEEF